MNRYVTCILLCVVLPLLFSNAKGGPPFQTDDPEPVDYLHWEFYVASMQEYAGGETDATLPHIEINYGALPNLQIHLLTPMGYLNGIEGPKYGYANTEFGMKYRFVQEDSTIPQIGVFPLIEIPTGDKAQGLSDGNAQVYLPVWVQKSFGKFTTYGGGGYWLNFGAGNRNWTFAGWEVQYDFSDLLTIGGEGFYHTAEAQDAKPGAGFNFGGFLNVNEHNHILFSVGHSLMGAPATTGYIGYQFTT